MRSPEQRGYTNRTSQKYDNEVSSRYNKQGAFTILPPEEMVPRDPPMAPQPYRLTPSSRRHKNLSFAILPEPNSTPGSRSPSPTGRVSPFRGRGFNPIGSRHASPIPSPPPGETFTTDSPHHSKIPKLSRRGSAVVFGEKIIDHQSSPNRRKLNAQLSQSLTNIAPRKVSNRPPPSPRRPQALNNKNVAFQRLSPIVGSSPEPTQSQSSPKNHNTSSNQQQNKFSSPGRSRSFVNRPPRNTSKPGSKVPSRNVSREPSPSNNPTSPTRIPVKNNYKNVQAKVNSFSRNKPKVPPKPQVLNEETTTTTDSDSNTKKKLGRKESVVKLRTNSKSNVIPKSVGNTSSKNTNSNNKTNNKNVTKDSNGNNVNNKNGSSSSASTSNDNKTNTVSKTGDGNNNKTDKIEDANKDKTNSDKTPKKSVKASDDDITTVDDTSDSQTKTDEGMKKSESTVRLSDILQPSTTAVVSNTTNTVTQPLKIEAKIDLEPKTDPKPDNKTFTPMVDGRILSATSVSNAMNKMNDTVLNTQTLMKETGLPSTLPKLSPAASTIIAMGNEAKQNNPAPEAKRPAPTAEKVVTKVSEAPTTNHVTSTGIIPARVLDEHVQNNMSKLVNPEHVGNSVQKSVADKIKEATPLVAHDVKPIKITVKEKPMDVEVQSGNIRFDTANGLNERPGLPPPQQPPNDPPPETQEPPKQNVCTRFLSSCKDKMSFKRFKKEKVEEKEEDKEPKKNIEKEGKTRGCFNCRKTKPDVTINVEEDEPKPKPKFWERLKCCSKNKISDTGCFPTAKRKSNWAERRDDSILSEQPPEKKSKKCSKDCCTGIFRKIFCLNKCRKNKKTSFEEEQISRRASMMSKKKSLTPAPVEDVKPKLDMSLVEHASQMKAAIPVLPLCLAWFCLIMNCIGPGTGTILSGLFCLCIGKPRFSQKDGPRPRIGAFIIDFIIGFGQFFTVLFCLVGWGWSIWWGVIMVKLAKKHKKIKALEENAQEESRQVPAAGQNHHSKDPERGS